MSGATVRASGQRPPPATRRSVARPGAADGHPWLFALPALIVYFVFLVYPALSSVLFSLTDWDGLSATYNIVGLDNYLKMP